MTDWLMGRSNLSLGPVNAYWDTGTGGTSTDLGGLENATVRFETEKADLVYSQYGTKPANRVVTGQSVEVEVRMAQSTLERCALTVQGLRLNQDTALTVLGYSYGNAIGEDDLTIVKQMDLVRLLEGAESADANDTVHFWKSAPAANAELTFDSASQHFIGVMFQCYRDDTQLDTEGKGTFFGSGTIA